MSSINLNCFYWYGTKKELHKLMESINGKLIDETEWDIVNNMSLNLIINQHNYDFYFRRNLRSIMPKSF